MTDSRRPRAIPTRRGNAMILTAGVLVLLVIIATAYVTRTQTARSTSVAVRDAASRGNNAQVVAESIAREITDALFNWPVDSAPPSSGALGTVATVSANVPRFAPAPDAIRFGIDFPDFPYNFTPYEVVPRTNWPDNGLAWPKGPGAPSGTDNLFEDNPLGNPGFGDSRWLRDLEPVRWDFDGDGSSESFRYWRHLTNIARPGNAWRVCRDISDVLGAGVVTNLDVPIEQWLISVQPDVGLFNTATGDAKVTDFALWQSQWDLWLTNDLDTFANQYSTQTQIPPNFINLKDIDADGFPLESGERPEDEFFGGSARWNVSRYLADADGDGFTDSFWFLAPTPIERGIRQIVAVSITDNSGQFPANVATTFWPGDITGAGFFGGVPGTAPTDLATKGETPADIAAVGEQVEWNAVVDPVPPPSWNVGLFDTPANWEPLFDYPGAVVGSYPLYGSGIQVSWNNLRWEDYLRELKVLDNPGDVFPNFLRTAYERRQYWLGAGLRPFRPAIGLTPFTLADEIELRLYHGQNHPWILSRFERAVNTTNPSFSFLRSGFGYDESSPYLDQLGNIELMHDNRRKITMYSGARNETMPPWLWWRWNTEITTGLPDVPQIVDDLGDIQAIRNFLFQSRLKLDLREWDFPNVAGYQPFHERLPWTILHALTDGNELGRPGSPPLPAGDAGSYLGTYTGGSTEAEDMRKLAASFTANILAYRDQDDHASIGPAAAVVGVPEQFGAVPLPEWGSLPRDFNTRYLGMEKQPFLLEAFVGHVYEMFEVPPGYLNSGDKFIIDQDEGGTTLHKSLVVVQIANPFDTEIDLFDPQHEYRIRLFEDMELSLVDAINAAGVSSILPPSRPEAPATMILYSIPDELVGDATFNDQWIDFLDLESGDHTPGTVLIDLRAAGLTVWSDDRDDYDGSGGAGSIGGGGGSSSPTQSVELVRVDRSLGPEAKVVIDRFDPLDVDEVDEGFGDVVAAFRRPPAYDFSLPTVPPPVPPIDYPKPTGGYDVSSSLTGTHWVQWARVSRSWGSDLNGDGVYGFDERNPRYINALSRITTAQSASFDQRPDYAQRIVKQGTVFRLASDPDQEPGDFNQPWITVNVLPPPGGFPGVYPRKPTFFDMNYAADPLFPQWSYPDKGYYHQGRFALQMLQKDRDFQQVGELLNVWVWTHELTFSAQTYEKTERTFSEHLLVESLEGDTNDEFINRLREGEVIGVPVAGDLFDPRNAVPNLPAAARLLDAFVCDGPGFNYDPDAGDLASDFVFGNAAGYEGRITPGLINLNTAPVEVLRTLPHWYRLVHDDPVNAVPADRFPRTRVAEALIKYRERYANRFTIGIGSSEDPSGP
ncbi:MAG: hypothetical protein HKO59_05925, partial [Phycisphaerales bacterium]|nr:hypothetical protein [Phycisphaerales bacterium]